MTGIIEKIDNSIMYWLKLHRTTLDDLTRHVQNDIPCTEINIDGIHTRITTLCAEVKVSQFNINGKSVWGTCGESTITNKVWETISSLSKNECPIGNIIYTITKQNPECTQTQIINAIGILEANEIIHVKNQTVILTNPEKSSIQRSIQN